MDIVTLNAPEAPPQPPEKPPRTKWGTVVRYVAWGIVALMAIIVCLLCGVTRKDLGAGVAFLLMASGILTNVGLSAFCYRKLTRGKLAPGVHEVIAGFIPWLLVGMATLFLGLFWVMSLPKLGWIAHEPKWVGSAWLWILAALASSTLTALCVAQLLLLDKARRDSSAPGPFTTGIALLVMIISCGICCVILMIKLLTIPSALEDGAVIPLIYHWESYAYMLTYPLGGMVVMWLMLREGKKPPWLTRKPKPPKNPFRHIVQPPKYEDGKYPWNKSEG